jgi:hydrogenase expression/formation protein HypE
MPDKILLAHGSGGKLAHDDSAVFAAGSRLAFTTDSYVVRPIFFPGGDIGRLAVCGTVNDLSMVGAKPLYLSLAFIIEEGLPFTDLERIVKSIRDTAGEAGVRIVTGDTKVVERGSADKIFINTAGVGEIPPGVNISGHNAKPGDAIILSGTIGDHGIAVLSQREGIAFGTSLTSDCAPLNRLVGDMMETSDNIHSLRDPTRGGLASTLNELAEQSGVNILIEESQIPVREEVKSACEMLGLDPLHIANEGKLVAVVDAADAGKIVEKMRRNRYGRDAVVIGKIQEGHPGRVTMRTRLGTSRLIDMLVGEPLPRIC